MQFTTAALSTIALAGGALAQSVVTSAPFNLFVTSEGSGKYNNAALHASHTGAAIEALAVGGESNPGVFNLNTTITQSGQTGPYNSGTVTWFLPAEPVGQSQPLQFYLESSTNLAQLIFGLGNAQTLSFDDDNELYIPSIYDDTVTPPTFGTTTVKQYRWFICQTNFEGYTYETLNWLYGPSKPANPSCDAVSVKRVFTS